MFGKLSEKFQAVQDKLDNRPAPEEHGGGGLKGALAAGGVGAAAIGYIHHKLGKSDSDSDSSDGHGGAFLAGAGALGLAGLGFFYALRRNKKQDYVVIVDASASMMSGMMHPYGATRWSETQKALGTLAERACKNDPDGLSLYFFSDAVTKFGFVRSAAEVDRIFSTFYPSGMTDLAAALDVACKEHFAKRKPCPTKILVIHDGEPNSEEAVRQVLRTAAASIKRPKDLHISLVQVGDDPQATAFLKNLDNGLGTKWDIVDHVSSTQLQGVAFSDAIANGFH